jgi:hypothetical protein
MQIVYRNIRFGAKVDQCLRRRWRMHGDLSIHVRESLDGVNLLEVKLLEVDYRRVHATQAGVFESMCLAVHEAASACGCSVNTLVNGAVWAAFGAQRPGQRGRPRRRNQHGVPVPEVSLGETQCGDEGALKRKKTETSTSPMF